MTRRKYTPAQFWVPVVEKKRMTGVRVLLGWLWLAGTCALLPTCGKSDPSRPKDGSPDMIGDSMGPAIEAGDGRDTGAPDGDSD